MEKNNMSQNEKENLYNLLNPEIKKELNQIFRELEQKTSHPFTKKSVRNIIRKIKEYLSNIFTYTHDKKNTADK